MSDQQPTRARLVSEIEALRARVADLERERSDDLAARSRIERVLVGQRRFFERLATGAPLEQALAALIEKIEGQIDGAMCAVMLLDHDGRRLRHSAASPLLEAYLQDAGGFDVGPDSGACGVAVFRDAPVIAADLATDLHWEGRSAVPLAHDLRAAWSVPFHDSRGAILGTFAIYFRAPRAPTEAELEELKNAAYLASVAVERKRAEDTLRASEQRYRALAEAMPLILWTTTPDGLLDYVNQRCADYYGVTVEQLRDRWQDMFHPDDIQRSADSRNTAVRNGQPYEIEYRPRRADGVYRWHLGRALPVRDERGAISFWVGTATDIDDQKRIEDALRQSEARFRIVSRATNDIIWDWDIVERRLEWNEYAEVLFGSASSQVGDYPAWWDEHLHPEDRERVIAGLLGVLEGDGLFWTDAYRFRRSDQDYAHVLDRGYIIRDAAGRAVRVIGAMQDITERKRAEAEVHRLNAELELRVAERTAQLEAANKELEAFSYSVSHDLRAPLRHIDGFARLLAQREDGRLDETSARYLRVIGEAARKMGQLIDDLLAFSRMSRTEMQSMGVDLNLVVEEVRRELTPMTEGRQITWQVGPLPAVRGDPAMIRVVFVNLISNALKYTAPRPVAEITITADEREDDEVVVTIRDNGVGFDMRYVHKLFGVFQRLHRDEEFEGTGIGLATVRRIISRHGGQVWAESELDHGAAFSLTLRRHRQE